jgi:AI-2 transport protein TqsA
MVIRDFFSPGLRFVLWTACITVTVAGLRFGATLLVPLALAIFVTVVSLPLIDRLLVRGFRPGLAVFVVLMLDVAALFGIVWLLVRSFTEVGAALPLYLARIGEIESQLLGWLASHGMQVAAIPYMELMPTDQVLALASAFLRGATDVMATTFVVVLIMVFLLAEAPAIPAKLRRAFGATSGDLVWVTAVLHEVQRYLALKTLISAATGVVVGLAAWLLGVDFALLWGLLAFFLNFIPNVGSILAAFPAVAIALLQHGLGIAAALAGVFLGVNMLIGNVIEPSLMGRRLGLSTVVVVLSLVFWGWVWGPVGMFLSVPLAMVAKIVLEHTSGYAWIAVLLAGSADRGADAPPADLAEAVLEADANPGPGSG